MKNKKLDICIIPARGGSKRIPNKNIKKFFGKPIINYTIDIIKKSKLFKKIVVSSDNPKILKIAKLNNCLTHLRSPYYASDHIDTISVVAKIVKDLEESYNINRVCCVYPTSIFITKKNLKEAYNKLKKKNNYVFSAAKFSHPIQRAFLKKSKKIEMFDQKFFLKGTQDLNEFYYDAAQFYIGWRNSWLKKKVIFQGPNKFIELNENLFQDIDNPEDWKSALLKWKFLKKNFKNVKKK